MEYKVSYTMQRKRIEYEIQDRPSTVSFMVDCLHNNNNHHLSLHLKQVLLKFLIISGMKFNHQYYHPQVNTNAKNKTFLDYTLTRCSLQRHTCWYMNRITRKSKVCTGVCGALDMRNLYQKVTKGLYLYLFFLISQRVKKSDSG